MKTTLLALIAFAITLTSFGQAPEGFIPSSLKRCR